MLKIVLFEPEIPPNTGNIMRLCANIGAELHLVEPLGFDLDEKSLRRAGLDYRDYTEVQTHKSLDSCFLALNSPRYLAFTTKAKHHYCDFSYAGDEVLLFGPETRGLPTELLASTAPEHCLKIPMLAQSRSLNLSNAVALVAYEAWKQQGFIGAKDE